MPTPEKPNREKIAALVREVLRSVPAAEDPAPAVSASAVTERVVVNSLKAKAEREFDRDESAKSLITEDDLRGLEPGSRVRVAKNAKFTPLAHDIVSDKGLQLIEKESRDPGLKIKSIGIGCDHGGFELKEQLKAYLTEIGVKVRDFGTGSKEPVDYPDFAHAVARAVSDRQTEAGLIVDGAGIGSAITANKVPGVRAAQCYSVALAKNSREHNGANVLTLGSGITSLAEAKEIVKAFLTTGISEDRHKQRVSKIDSIDRDYRR